LHIHALAYDNIGARFAALVDAGFHAGDSAHRP